MAALVERLFPAAHANPRTVRVIAIGIGIRAVVGVAGLSSGETLGGLGSAVGGTTPGTAAVLMLGLLLYATASAVGTVGLVRVLLNLPSQVITGFPPLRALFFGQGARLPREARRGAIRCIVLMTGHGISYSRAQPGQGGLQEGGVVCGVDARSPSWRVVVSIPFSQFIFFLFFPHDALIDR